MEKLKETLLVKCPYCEKFVDLGSDKLKVYDDPGPFILLEECAYCKQIIGHEDTSESDYRKLDF